MDIKYKLGKTVGNKPPHMVTKDCGNGFFLHIPFDPANTDYQAYLKWLEEGNQPLPADDQPA